MILPSGSDDTLRLQTYIDGLSDRAILTLKHDAVYQVTRPLSITKRVWLRSDLEGRPATLHCPRMAESWMALLLLGPKQGLPLRWTEKLLAGNRPGLAPIAAGKPYVCGYGANPYASDPAENHYRGFSDGAGLPAAPRDISGEEHWAQQLLSSCDGSILQDIRFTSAPDVNIDFALGVGRCRGVVIRNLAFDTRMAMSVMDSRGVSIEGVRGKVHYVDGMTASGRILTCWQSFDVAIRDVDVEISDWASPFVAEAWCDGLSYDDVRLRLRREKPSWPPAPIWFSNGGTRNQVVRNFAVEGDLYLYDCGGAPAGTFELPRFVGANRYSGANMRQDIAVENLVNAQAFVAAGTK